MIPADASPGHVREAWWYPVKSMRGVRCDALSLDARGVVGDRTLAVRDRQGKLGSGKSTRRFVRIDGLCEVRPIVEGDALVALALPDGRTCSLRDDALSEILSAHLGLPVTLAREAQVSHLDRGAIHLVTTASLAWLRDAAPGAGIDARRLRPNLVIAVPGAEQVERSWIGRTLAIGAHAQLQITAMTQRCVMTTTAQADLPHAPAILEAIARREDLCLGVYADVVVPGRIREGDPIRWL